MIEIGVIEIGATVIGVIAATGASVAIGANVATGVRPGVMNAAGARGRKSVGVSVIIGVAIMTDPIGATAADC
ncbi:hypothetical protein GCM10010520_24340 [Rhizobium viscosum]